MSAIDTHTEGEPTRIVLSGLPPIRGTTMADKWVYVRENMDHLRRALMHEPRGHRDMFGAILTSPCMPEADFGLLYMDSGGFLTMCGHGTIGLIATLQYLGRIAPGVHRVDTPVGTVSCTLHADGKVSIRNIASWRHRKGVEVRVEGYGKVAGDVAWGGNWFFLVDARDHRLHLDNIDALIRFSRAIREALTREKITGPQGEEIDHIEVFGAPADPTCNSRNFVLCPGSAYDRSPCGTGTSAKLACLAADGKLAEGAAWRQESIVGSVFEGSYQNVEGGVVPTITGQAHVCGEGTLLLDPADPFCWGIH